jgi:GntR family transcriptional regulator
MASFDAGQSGDWNADNNIDPNQVVPLYHQIYLILREQILEGRFEAVPLPGELMLAEQFKVSRVTMRRALQDLVKEGLIARGRGKGTFVKPRREVARGSAQNQPMTDSIVSMDGGAMVEVLDVSRVTAMSDIAEQLRLAPREQVQKVVRVLSVKGQPMGHFTTYIPESVARIFSRREMQVRPLVELLEESGIEVGTSSQTLSARLADSSVAGALEIPVGAPLVAVARMLLSQTGKPVCLLRALYRPDRYEYRMEMAQFDHARGRVWQTVEQPSLVSF